MVGRRSTKRLLIIFQIRRIEQPTKIALTVLIPTYNEEDHIVQLLQQVQWADELMVVDSFSTDKTVERAKNLGATVLQRAYDSPANQKNWAIPQAKHPWVLILDADERLTPALTQEIQDILQKPSTPYSAYWIGRLNYFMGQPLYYSGLQNDAVIRLIRRDQCAYNNKQVHEEIESTGKIGRLTNKMEHYTYKSLEHYLAKTERYARWSAQDHRQKTAQVGFFHLCFKPFFRFVNTYLIKRGILDGRVGFIFSSIMAWGVFLRYVNLREEQRSSKKP